MFTNSFYIKNNPTMIVCFCSKGNIKNLQTNSTNRTHNSLTCQLVYLSTCQHINSSTLQRYFSRTKAAMVLFIIDNTELSRGNAMDIFGRVNDTPTVRQLFNSCWMVLRCVANLEGNLLR